MDHKNNGQVDRLLKVELLLQMGELWSRLHPGRYITREEYREYVCEQTGVMIEASHVRAVFDNVLRMAHLADRDHRRIHFHEGMMSFRWETDALRAERLAEEAQYEQAKARVVTALANSLRTAAQCVQDAYDFGAKHNTGVEMREAINTLLGSFFGKGK